MLQANINRLDEELQSHAASKFRVTWLAAKAQSDMDRAQHNVEVLYAIKYTEIRKKKVAEGVKPTDENVKAEVYADADYIASKLAYIQAKETHLLLSGLGRDMEAKTQMLVMLASRNKPV